MKRFILILGMMVFICLALSASSIGEEDTIIVTIRPGPGNTITVDKEIVLIKYGTFTTVKWVKEDFPPDNHPPDNFHIHFNKPGYPNPLEKSPFAKEHYGRGHDQANNRLGSDNSGFVRENIQISQGEVKRYGYTVRVQGYQPLDPGIIIWQ